MRRGQKIGELCAGALRALVGDASLHYRAERLHRGDRPLPIHAPHLQPDPAWGALASFRGVTDGVALRLRHSDLALHRRLCPDDPVERLVFELLEQLRVEALVPAHLPGVARNLAHRFEAWSRAFHAAGLTETSLGILIYTVAQVCRSRLLAQPVLADTEDLIEATRASISPLLGRPLAQARRERNHQARFAPHALEIARLVGESVRHAQANAGEGEGEAEPEARAGFALLLDFDAPDSGDVAAARTGDSRAFEDAGGRYRVFTGAHDRELAAAPLVRAALLDEFRERLDRRIASLGVNRARLARTLAALLANPQRDGWHFGQEEGRVDGRRLAQLVASPSERRLFRTERVKPVAECVVSFLVDCSGSMKDHVETLAVLIDVLAGALESAGARTEVLGFTTAAWNGGRAYQEWLARGRPKAPGRLAELRHLVFKEADRPWRRARRDVAALLKPDLFREGVDGEAVEWACSRLLARPEPRRVVVVISDGCPMESATALANDAFYLDNHLKDVVARHEQLRDVAIIGLGVGLDLSPFYRRHLALDVSRTLDNALFFEIARLIGGRERLEPDFALASRAEAV